MTRQWLMTQVPRNTALQQVTDIFLTCPELYRNPGSCEKQRAVSDKPPIIAVEMCKATFSQKDFCLRRHNG